ncbi:hypothetical protein T06_9250, partial [Trichinella sp. T6]
LHFDFVKLLTHEKHCIQISKHVTNYGKIMHMENAHDRIVCWSIAFVGQLRSLVKRGTLEKIDTIWRCQVWKASSLQRHNTQT